MDNMWSIIWSQWTIYVVVLLLGYWMYRRTRSKTNIFAERGIAYRKSASFVGDIGDVMFRKISFYDMILNTYRLAEGKSVFGIQLAHPTLYVSDPELIKQITVKNFDSFVDHKVAFKHTGMEPFLTNSLIMLRGEKWRDMRSTLSPAFTGSKMRYLFQLIDECTQRTVGVLKEETRSKKPYVVELKDFFSRFANDVIATAAFGIEVNSVKDPRNQFYTIGLKSLDFTSMPFFIRSIVAAITHYFTVLPNCLKLRLFTADKVQFYHSLVHDTMRYREQHGTVRPDMIQLLMEARKGALVHDDGQEASGSKSRRVWEDDDITAQCFLFFLAGFETISNALSFLGHELVLEPSVQTKLVDELDRYREEMNGRPLVYDDLAKLKYLDMVISEILRKWPGLVIDRECTNDCQLTDSSGNRFDAKTGDTIWIPILGIHRDPKYFDDPEKFDPERFSDERKHLIQPFTYMPFGSGPRNCIGSRFALLELKVFMFHFLGAFTFGRAESTQIPLVIGKTGFSFKSERGINIELVPRQK